MLNFLTPNVIDTACRILFAPVQSRQDGRELFLLAAVLVIVAALAVHFKLQHIYSSLVDTYRPR